MVTCTARATACQLVLLCMSAWVSGDEDEAEVGDIVCQGHGGMTIRRMGSDSINITSAIELDNPADSDKIVLDIVLSGQDAQLDLPGMIVRLRTSEDFGPGYSAYSGTHERLSFEDLQDVDKVQQSFGDIIFGNLLSIILCLTGTCVIIFFEKKFKCIGGQKIHNMVEQQHQLSEDVKSVVQVVTALKESTEQSIDPETGQVNGGGLIKRLFDHSDALHGVEKMVTDHLGKDNIQELKDAAHKIHHDAEDRLHELTHNPDAAKSALHRVEKVALSKKQRKQLHQLEDAVEHGQLAHVASEKFHQMKEDGTLDDVAERAHHAADLALEKGKHAKEVAAQHGITAKHAKEVAAQHGITAESAKEAAHATSKKAKDVAAQHGITAESAKEAAHATSKKAKDVAAQHGITAESAKEAAHATSNKAKAKGKDLSKKVAKYQNPIHDDTTE